MKVYKKVLGFIVCVIMVISLLPAMAFAGDGSDDESDIESDTVTVYLEMGQGHAVSAGKVLEACESYSDDSYNNFIISGERSSDTSTLLTLTVTPKNSDMQINYGTMLYILRNLVIAALDDDWYEEGEAFYDIGLRQISQYQSERDYYNEYEEYGETPVPNQPQQKFYALWVKPVKNANITVKSPLCGTYVSVDIPDDSYYPVIQEPQPEVTVTSSECELNTRWLRGKFVNKELPDAYWVTDKEGSDYFAGKMTGRGPHYASIGIVPKFGYFFDYDNLPTVSINGKKGNPLQLDGHYGWNEIPYHPAGVQNSHERTLYYVGEVEIEHIWDNGVVTKKPTPKEEGIRTYTCTKCGETKTEVIPKLDDGIKTEADIPAKTMKLTWAKDDSATGYKVAYRQTGKKWKTKKVKTNTCKLKGMKMKKYYEFKVAPIYKDGTTGAYSEVNYRYFRAVKGKATGKKNAAKLTWTKEPKANGYIVYCSTSKSMKTYQSAELAGKNKKSYTFKGLKKGKTYYVMVRSYINKGGKRYLGVTCKIRKVKAK